MTSEIAIPALVDNTITPAEYQRAVDHAKEKAVTLDKIVTEQQLFTEMGSGDRKKKYLHLEAWVTIAQGYGLGTQVDWSRPVDGGGWEARVLVIANDGTVVGAAESECGTKGDSMWINRPSYSQRSMAQTRAASKALRTRLSWVVTLAGYAPTPFEEMPDEKEKDEHNPVNAGPSAPKYNAEGHDIRTPTDKQFNRLWAIAKGAGKAKEHIEADIAALWGLDSIRNLNITQYDELCGSYENLPKVS